MPGPTERATRENLIDPALRKAGWDVDNPNQVGREIPVDGFDLAAWEALRAQLVRDGAAQLDPINLPAGISDYALYRPNGEIIAVVEAKRTSVDPRLAQTQAEFYSDEIGRRQNFKPFAFMANGRDIYFLDVGVSPKRLVAGFFSPDDLEQMLYIRQNGMPLTHTLISQRITDRAYQHEAIRRVCETFEQGRRRALLVMATGTGKTRTAVSLVDVFLRSNQARRVLFVADRDPLVEQALTDGFQKHLPDEPAMRIYTHHIDTSKRLYVSTLQTLSVCYGQFTPAFFDIIIFDEVHRSIFNQWNDALHYFDGRVIGLTATPADFIDRNTFLEFDCAGGTPTFLYAYKQAVDEKYLVDYTLYQAQTRFQRTGIKGVDLSEEERNTLIQRGIDPDSIDYEGTDLEQRVSNKDTLRRQWAEIWDVCLRDQSGQLPGKTIVFAMTQDHALRLAEVFEEMYPQFPDLVRVITYKSDYKRGLIDAFKRENMPRVAITVDLLETGIDVPEVVNLVFMKPVQSRIKLEQMIGRGTRSQAACTFLDRLPDGRKKEFVIIDFWDNDFSKPPEEEIAQSLPVLVTIFNTRLQTLETLLPQMPLSADHRATYDQVAADLRAMIAAIPLDTYAVKQVYPAIESAWQDTFWLYLTRDKLLFLRLKVGPLLRYVPGVDVEAATFTSKVERLKLLRLTGKDASATARSITEDVSRLPDFVTRDPRCEPLVRLCLSGDLASARPEELTHIVDGLAGQMKNRRKRENTFLELDLADAMVLHGYILLRGGTERVYVEEYRKRVEERILTLVDTHPTMQAIGRGEPVSGLQLLDLERTLRRELALGDVELTEDNIRKAFGFKVGSLLEFLRRLLDLDNLPDYADIIRREFEGFIASHAFNADQIRFLRAAQSMFVRRRQLHRADLYEPPLTSFGVDAVERWFTPSQVNEVLSFVTKLEV